MAGIFPRPFQSKKGRNCSVNEFPRNPFPIPLKDYTGIPYGRKASYEAQIFYGSILVCNQEHAQILYDHGCFGSGTLSRRGFNYRKESKVLTRSQIVRKEQWSRDYTSQSLSKTHLLSLHRCQPNPYKKFVSVLEDTSNPKVNNKDMSGECEPSTSSLLKKRCEVNVQVDVELEVDPYPLDEPLVLLPEEALFLCYALGCLIIRDMQGKPMNIDELWQYLTSKDPHLAYNYKAYHDLRVDGWVVRCGLRYGAVYALYRESPDLYHADYLVHVEAHDAASLTPLPHYRHITSLTYINTLNRIAAAVNKVSMIVIVLVPPDYQEFASNIEECVKKLRSEHLPFVRFRLEDFMCGQDKIGFNAENSYT